MAAAAVKSGASFATKTLIKFIDVMDVVWLFACLPAVSDVSKHAREGSMPPKRADAKKKVQGHGLREISPNAWKLT
ncbi:MAG: hypothetical protein P8L18_02140 [Verrucomicrobiota bacterium]|nr:hypothetical protein [Verrucomicrobiota bacterium]